MPPTCSAKRVSRKLFPTRRRPTTNTRSGRGFPHNVSSVRHSASRSNSSRGFCISTALRRKGQFHHWKFHQWNQTSEFHWWKSRCAPDAGREAAERLPQLSAALHETCSVGRELDGWGLRRPGVVERGVGGGEAGDGDAVGGAAHVVQPDAVEELHRARVAAVLAADAELEVGLHGATQAA